MRVSPLVSAALTCSFSSCGRFSALIIARFRRLRSRRDRPSRDQTWPQQYSVESSWIGRLNSSAAASERSTYSRPSTSLRISSPRSNFSLLMRTLSADLAIGPGFDDLGDLGAIRIRPEPVTGDRQDLAHRRAYDHRHAQGLGLV